VGGDVVGGVRHGEVELGALLGDQRGGVGAIARREDVAGERAADHGTLDPTRLGGGDQGREAHLLRHQRRIRQADLEGPHVAGEGACDVVIRVEHLAVARGELVGDGTDGAQVAETLERRVEAGAEEAEDAP
jgi:hypothetical protein